MDDAVRTPTQLQTDRDRLVDAARSVLVRDGAVALTMRNIANEAGCALGLPYKLFESRSQLLLEVAARELDDLTSRLDTWLAGTGERPVAENLDLLRGDLLQSETPRCSTPWRLTMNR